MEKKLLTVGELARQVGLTVRALHHYDAIGLLSPSLRTASGARRYGKQDIIRLHRIQAMKQLYYPLPVIRSTLDDTSADPLECMRLHLRSLELKAEQARKLCDELQYHLTEISEAQAPTFAKWLDSLEMAAIYKNQLTQPEVLTIRKPKGIDGRQLDANWQTMIEMVGSAMHAGVEPDSTQAHALAWEWIRLVIAKTSNAATLEVKLRAIQMRDARAQAIVGITTPMMDWIAQAIAHARTALFAKYLTPTQTENLQARQLSAMTNMERWTNLTAKAQDRFNAKTSPKDPVVLSLAGEWQQLFRESYCGDDTEMERRIRTAFANESDLMLGVGVTAELVAYMHEAITCLQYAKTHG
jgi:DNA-binding transcriptional MerR regulator